MKASIAPNGSLRVSVPAYAPMFMVKRMINSLRDELRSLMESRPSITVADGAPIGKSHSMILRLGPSDSVRTEGLRLVVTTKSDITSIPSAMMEDIRGKIISILRKEAKAHLPRRMRYLADKHGFDYSSLRFTHASSRWGSCNSKKAISLNIALMNIPFELIDYVLVHELAHTVHMNHSKEFWNEVARADPSFTAHRKQLKQHNPTI